MFKQPQLQIGRDYTPLPPTSSTSSPEEEDDGCLRFLIRRDPHGEVSRYLHALELGSTVEVRGPKVEFAIPSETQEILFIAGGTGIAPAVQAGHSLLTHASRTSTPRIHILWASRKREDCAGGVNDTQPTIPKKGSWLGGWFGRAPETSSPPTTRSQREENACPMVRDLEDLKAQFPNQVKVDYFVDEENSLISKQTILDSVKSSPSPSGNSPGSKFIIVSGPDGFIRYMAGEKIWAQGSELQGPLQGILKELDLKDWAVWKL
ncbi:hypothetical protein ASPZODRAFT_135755 [Penicilliopsis zonata CBS 506.65]|uniref:Flavoprotein pyridine nucleotide cytochrome reductase-like FAD-binding domain-containing protein n=1 Tax=Penicilliopsis zonata CBS 506.65 TaxID=1073090 RepID=A0A1L9S9A5_9EURO|nr:hypothetical protein ASPZODRAFT_135755 [Penicilliopsis zonata CBS 506.65]OJJ43735.1 hypothetical protein ASPZODRAFT_135755 [Penicilliopsis zonata CBS 506.65]